MVNEPDVKTTDTLTVEDLRRGLEILKQPRVLICGDIAIYEDRPSETCVLPCGHRGEHERVRI